MAPSGEVGPPWKVAFTPWGSGHFQAVGTLPVEGHTLDSFIHSFIHSFIQVLDLEHSEAGAQAQCSELKHTDTQKWNLCTKNQKTNYSKVQLFSTWMISLSISS